MSESLTSTFDGRPREATEYVELSYADLGMDEPPQPAGERFMQAYLRHGLAGLGVFLLVPLALVVFVLALAFMVILAPFAAWFFIATRTMFFMPALTFLPESYFRELRWDITGVNQFEPTHKSDEDD